MEKEAAEIPSDEQFLHRFAASKKFTKNEVIDGESNASDIESVNSEEFEEYLGISVDLLDKIRVTERMLTG